MSSNRSCTCESSSNNHVSICVTQSSPLFTVFIPTFNRAHTLVRALDSVVKQSCKDYEILVIDDGSTDGTDALVKDWQKRHHVDLQYVYQPNQGKHVAYNTATSYARGELLALLDSDDMMLPDALQALADAWYSIPEDERDGFAGVEGLCERADGQLHGSPFPADSMDSNYLEMIRYHGVDGEKR